MLFLWQNVRIEEDNTGIVLLTKGLRFRVDHKETFRIRKLTDGQLYGYGTSGDVGSAI